MTRDALNERIEITRQVKEIISVVIREKYEIIQISNDTYLFGGGLDFDSIDMLELIPKLEGVFKMRIFENNAIEALYSVNSIVERILKIKHLKTEEALSCLH